MNSPPPAASFSLQAAADHLGLSRQQMVALVESGTVAAYFEGWNRRIRAREIDAFAARSCTAARCASAPARKAPGAA